MPDLQKCKLICFRASLWRARMYEMGSEARWQGYNAPLSPRLDQPLGLLIAALVTGDLRLAAEAIAKRLGWMQLSAVQNAEATRGATMQREAPALVPVRPLNACLFPF